MTDLRRASRSRPAKFALVVLAAVIIVPGILYKVPQLVGQDDAFIVLSGSMVPTFLPGDVIFVRHVESDSLQVGDAVTFHAAPNSPLLVTHRIIEVVHDSTGGTIGYRTQGDANASPDPNVRDTSTVVGKYDFRIPYWGLLSTVLKTRIGYVAFILVPGIAIILVEFVKLYRELDARDGAKKSKKTTEFEIVDEVRHA